MNTGYRKSNYARKKLSSLISWLVDNFALTGQLDLGIHFSNFRAKPFKVSAEKPGTWLENYASFSTKNVLEWCGHICKMKFCILYEVLLTV